VSEKECRRYADLLSQAPTDISFLGIGENGHIGFNDPHTAKFSDSQTVKVVTLDERCRLQQVGEGHWPNLSSAASGGITITCPALVNAAYIICSVPGPQKAEAVRNALEGPISTACLLMSLPPRCSRGKTSLKRTQRNKQDEARKGHEGADQGT
jgi:glucosamine-6-phosphate deaminase